MVLGGTEFSLPSPPPICFNMGASVGEVSNAIPYYYTYVHDVPDYTAIILIVVFLVRSVSTFA